MELGIAVFGFQVVTTTCYTYAIDCHREQSTNIAQLFNFVCQMFGFTFAFYAVLLCDRIGYQFTFLLFAVLGSVGGFYPNGGLYLERTKTSGKTQ